MTKKYRSKVQWVFLAPVNNVIIIVLDKKRESEVDGLATVEVHESRLVEVFIFCLHQVAL